MKLIFHFITFVFCVGTAFAALPSDLGLTSDKVTERLRDDFKLQKTDAITSGELSGYDSESGVTLSIVVLDGLVSSATFDFLPGPPSNQLTEESMRAIVKRTAQSIRFLMNVAPEFNWPQTIGRIVGFVSKNPGQTWEQESNGLIVQITRPTSDSKVSIKVRPRTRD